MGGWVLKKRSSWCGQPSSIIIPYYQSIDPLLIMLRFRRPVSRLESQRTPRRLPGDLNKQFGGFVNSRLVDTIRKHNSAV